MSSKESLEVKYFRVHKLTKGYSVKTDERVDNLVINLKDVCKLMRSLETEQIIGASYQNLAPEEVFVLESERVKRFSMQNVERYNLHRLFDLIGASFLLLKS
jgi:hypothetical protein